MPTGYTDAVGKGEVVDFDDFARKCARAMGACIMQRDDPHDAPVKMDTVSNYYSRSIKEDKKDIKEFESMTTEEKLLKFSKYKAEQLIYHLNVIAKNSEVEKNYRSMLENVLEWEAPTEDHVGFKDFMEDQLTESIKFDCNPKWSIKSIQNLHDLTFEDWCESYLENLWDSIRRSNKNLREEIQRVQERNIWKSKLFCALESK